MLDVTGGPAAQLWARAPSSGSGDTTIQLGFDDLGPLLSETTFVTVDLETTGGSSAEDSITEIGAVKTRAGEILGEFQTLINPGVEIPRAITRLTGIDSQMVELAPTIASVLPSFLEFAHGCVLVAHNAKFDIGFLKAAARSLSYPWPGFTIVDTVPLARCVVPKSEVPNHKLATLAALFSAATSPSHRALDDARATVDVFHTLLERLAAFGVTHLADLSDLTRTISATRMSKRHLATGLPQAPGVYVFKDERGDPLYVGMSNNIRRRVRHYFTTSEKRAKMEEMITLAHSVTPIVCATTLEANVRELRLIEASQPRYNRRSRSQHRLSWLQLSSEPFPRLVVTSKVPDANSPASVGPFTSTSAARSARDAIHAVTQLRRCAQRINARSPVAASICALAEMSRCAAPCHGSVERERYGELVDRLATMLVEDITPLVTAVEDHLRELSAMERFEEAARLRDGFTALLTALARSQRILPLAHAAEIVAARRTKAGGWELVCLKHARLAGACVAKPCTDSTAIIAALRSAAEAVSPGPHGLPAASIEEASILLNWLDQEGTRLVYCSTGWAEPIRGAAQHERWLHIGHPNQAL